jgi:hypothetical protein
VTLILYTFINGFKKPLKSLFKITGHNYFLPLLIDVTNFEHGYLLTEELVCSVFGEDSLRTGVQSASCRQFHPLPHQHLHVCGLIRKQV